MRASSMLSSSPSEGLCGAGRSHISRMVSFIQHRERRCAHALTGAQVAADAVAAASPCLASPMPDATPAATASLCSRSRR